MRLALEGSGLNSRHGPSGAIGFLLDIGWMRTFGFTNYRDHLAHFGLPLGIVTLCVSLLFLWFGVATIRAHMTHGNESTSRDADLDSRHWSDLPAVVTLDMIGATSIGLINVCSAAKRRGTMPIGIAMVLFKVNGDDRKP